MGCRVSLQVHPMPMQPEIEEDPVDQEDQEEESVETKIKKAVLSKFQKKETLTSTVVPIEPKESYETVYIDEADFV